MEHEAEGVTQSKTDSLLEELYAAGIVVGGHGTFGRLKGFNRDSDPHKVTTTTILIQLLVDRF